MSKFESSDQNTRLKATTQLIQQLEQDYTTMYNLTQSDISGISQNLSDINSKLQQQSCQVLKVVFDNLDSDDNEFVQMTTQDFNINFIINQTFQNFKAAKIQQRLEMLELSNTVAKYLINIDSVTKELESIFKVSKNQFQKQVCCQFIQENVHIFDNKQNQKLQIALQSLKDDSNTEVRQISQEVIDLLISTEPNTKSQKNNQQKSLQLNKSQAMPNQHLSKSTIQKVPQKANSKDPVSLFTPPSESDQQAQNGPFAIVPPIQQSYLAFKPIYLFEIMPITSKQLEQIHEYMISNNIGQLKNSIQQFFDDLTAKISNEKEWQSQFTGFQSIYQLLLLDNRLNNPNINLLIGEQICLFLQSEQICKIIQSPRSTLSREALITLEFVIQRYGPLCNSFINTVLDTIFQLMSKKGVYFECQSASLLKSIIVHCGLQKSIYVKLCQQLKTQKVPSAKCYLIDAALLAILTMKIMNQFDNSLISLITDSLIQGIQDKDARVRQTSRVFVNCLQYLHQTTYQQIINKLGQKELQNLQLSNNYEAGYQVYSEKITCKIDEEYFPSFLIQSGACHQEIFPVYDNSLQSWRLQLVLNEQFQIFWDKLNEFTQSVNYEDYCNWLGFSQHQEIQYQTSSEHISPQQETMQQPKSVYIPKAKLHQESYEEDVIQKQPQFNSNKPSTKSADNISPKYNSNKQNTSILPKINMDDNISDEIMDAIEVKTKQTVTKGKQQQSQQIKHQKEPSPQYNTAINLRPQLIENSILLNDIQQDLANIQEYLINDELSQTQTDDLIQNIMANVFTQNERTTLELQNILLQIITMHTLNNEQLELIVTALVDLFNDQYLNVRRKSDEIVRAVIEIADPTQLFKIFQSIIVQNRMNRQKQLNVNASLRLVTYVVRKCQQKQKIIQQIAQLTPLVIEQFNSSDANMRKTAVSCFIDLFMVLGQDFQQYVDSLNDNQLKLVVERMKQIQIKK